MSKTMTGIGVVGIGIALLVGYGAQQEPVQQVAFPDSAFYWDDATTPFRLTITSGVNAIANRGDLCDPGTVDPSSAYISETRSTATNPAFFVACERRGIPVNVFFTSSGPMQ